MDAKPLCKYGDQCYRKNPDHLAEFQHPDKSEPTGVVGGVDRHRSRSPIDSAPKAKPATAATASKTVAEKPRRESATSTTTDDSRPAKTGSAEADAEAMPADSEAKCKSSSGHQQKCFDSNTDASMLEEYKALLSDRPEFIRQKFMVNMPEDFYRFFEFCETQNSLEPCQALQNFGLLLAGPYDVLNGKFDDLPPMEPSRYLRHCRLFYDPPEFQTVLISQPDAQNRGVHFGYWRDDPSLPAAAGNCFIAKNDEEAGCEVTIVADNIFVAVIQYLDTELAKSPFVRAAAQNFSKKLRAFGIQHGIPMDEFQAKNRKRNLAVVCKTFHTAGLVVPMDRKTQVGYRPLLENEADLKKILSRLDDPEDGGSEAVLELVMEKLQPLITAANIAVDECDFGNSIELGINLFCSGSPRLHAIAMQLLATGYSMVHRPQLIAILKAHLSQRKRGALTGNSIG